MDGARRSCEPQRFWCHLSESPQRFGVFPGDNCCKCVCQEAVGRSIFVSPRRTHSTIGGFRKNGAVWSRVVVSEAEDPQFLPTLRESARVWNPMRMVADN